MARRTCHWYRVHQLSLTPVFFGKKGGSRFDAPAGEFGVLYVGRDAHCAFIETFGHATGVRSVTTGELAARGMAVITCSRPLRLLDLTGKGLARIGADARLTSSDDYGLSHRWSKAIHDHRSRPDGRAEYERLKVILKDQPGGVDVVTAELRRLERRLRDKASNHQARGETTRPGLDEFVPSRPGEQVDPIKAPLRLLRLAPLRCLLREPRARSTTSQGPVPKVEQDVLIDYRMLRCLEGTR
jgi:hypothetical protein